VLAQHALDPLGETLVTHTTLLPRPAARQSCSSVVLVLRGRGHRLATVPGGYQPSR
jgi:hypothetical protein